MGSRDWVIFSDRLHTMGEVGEVQITRWSEFVSLREYIESQLNLRREEILTEAAKREQELALIRREMEIAQDLLREEVIKLISAALTDERLEKIVNGVTESVVNDVILYLRNSGAIS